MKPTLTLLTALLLAPPAPLSAQESAGRPSGIATFSGPTPGTLRSITIPTVDISGDTRRHVIVARGTDKDYQGHCDTVLMADGKTMFAAWCMNHAGHLGPLARSDDGGLTWSAPLGVPSNWQEVKKTTPVLHRLTDPRGVERLFIFGGCDFPGNIRRAFSEDGGKTWSPMAETGLVGEVAPKSILPFDDGKRLIMWSDRRDPNNAKDEHPVVWQSESLDGGLTWSKERVLLAVPGQWAQPSVTRSADGRRLLMLMRENTRKHHSLYSVSTDDARTWSEPKELPAALTGDRHVIKRTPDGRLVVAFRDMAKASPTYGHYVAWVGTFEDIENRREGQYRIKLLHNANRTAADAPGTGNTDCGYSDLELLGDGTVIATTYVKYATGPEKNSVVSTRFKLSETDDLAKQTKTSALAPSLLPAGWDPALAGDVVMQGLIKVTAPQVKGAHDAEFVCVGERAYIVEHDNDVAPGHGAGAAMYCVLTVVNLKTLRVENTHLLAKAGQAFANVTLADAQVFVPRIVRKDEHTLRTYFCSQPAKEQAVTWYRDFDLRTLTFEGSIHKAKLRTAAGVFDMEPRHFHADAAAQGFTKPSVNQGLYIFDAFKEFDGRRYVALNNFPGKQNALAVLHDDFTTFEVIGHYNEPQSQQLSESAVNRLPDGTWMAICRNDAGNYHFTTSQDGKAWTIGEPKPFVPNGLNSKPTFDKFGGVYYLGWQENTRVHGCNRSVFNVDISRDGVSWERKYRFETPHSFQYPTFHEHEGTIWLTVTQSDHLGSSDRIMFGKLENLTKPAVKVTQELLNSIHVTPKLIFDPFPAYAQKYLPFAMAASMESTHKGRLWTCWAGGQDGPNAYLLASYSDDQGKSWRDPVFVIDPQAHGLKMGTRLGSFWCDPKGRLWLFFHQSVGMFDGSCGNWYVRCDDPDAEKPVWTDAVYIGFGASLNKPIVRKSGEWILPVSLWERWHIDKPFADCYRELDAVRGANVFVSDDEGGHWRYRGGIIFKDSNFNEHSVVELNDGRLWMLARCKKETAQSFSADGGKTWEAQSTAFPHVNSKSVIRRLQSGNMLVIRHGHDITKATAARQELTAFLTTDEGKSWSGKLLLDERTGVSYPDIAQAPNGDIYVNYDRNRSTDAEILFARFREDDVKAGRLVYADASLKNLVKGKLGMNRSGAGDKRSAAERK